MIIPESIMQVQRSWPFSSVVACLFSSGVTAIVLCMVLVLPNQSSIELGTLNSNVQDYGTRIRQLERQLVDMGALLEKTEDRLHQLELVTLHISEHRHSGGSSRDPPRDRNDAIAMKAAEETNRYDDDIFLARGVQRPIMANLERIEENGKVRSLRSTRQRQDKRERTQREPKRCTRRCKGEKGDKGDVGPVGPVTYGGDKGRKGERGETGPAGSCECGNPPTGPELTTTGTSQYTMILAAHFEGDVESISSIHSMRRDPINMGYVDLGASNDGWVAHWRYAAWMGAETRDKFYLDYFGNVTVNEGGIYYVYSQMLYYDPSVFMGHSVYIGDQKRFSCTECTVDRDRKFNTCYIGGVVQIKAGDKVGVKVSYANRVINLNPESTHFGMIRLS